MHNPGPEELEALLPANWINAQESSSQTIEVEVCIDDRDARSLTEMQEVLC